MVIDELPDAINLRSAAIMTFEKNRSRLFPDHLRFGKTPWLKSRVVSAFNESQADYFSTYHAPKDPILKNELDEIQKTGFSLVLPLKGSSSLSALLFFGPKKVAVCLHRKTFIFWPALPISQARHWKMQFSMSPW